jgi:hypothetical protein
MLSLALKMGIEMKSALEINLELAVAGMKVYAFVWTSMAITTTFISILVLLNIDRLAQIRASIRRPLFATYLVLCLLNIPFGLFFSKFFLALGQAAALQSPASQPVNPFFNFGALAAQTGIASHILFALFFGLSWLAVESRAK